MRAFPPAAELQFLVGQEVGQIALDPWSTQIRFADGGSILIQGGFEHLDAQGRLHRHQNTETQDTSPVYLRDLIQKSVQRLTVEPFALTLHFDNGAHLRILSEDSAYEDCVIYRSDDVREAIVA